MQQLKTNNIRIIFAFIGVFLISWCSAQNNLEGYEYWFNNDYSNKQAVNITPTAQHQLLTNIDATSLNDGINVFNIRYWDENNIYSSTISKVFYKDTEVFIANKNLVAYEYWFNNDYNNKQVINITPATQHQLSSNIDATSLNDGINVLNIRYLDENNIYSSTLSKIFYKDTEVFIANKNLVAYEYWFNNDYNNKQVINITPATQHQLLANIDATSLNDGINVLNIRYLDENNIYSSTLSKIFYKDTEILINNKNLVAYEYWFNNDYNNKQVINITPATQHQLLANIDATSLNDGINVLNIRYQDENNIFSSTLSKMFYKKENHIVNNKIFGYHYWFDNDFMNKVYVQLVTPTTQLNLTDSIDLTQIAKGQHAIHYQFHDSLNVWSIVTTDSVEKTSFPIANFNYSSTVNCDSTIISFNDLSIDGDTYWWDFGDSYNDSVPNPTHTYFTPGTYLVSLTVTDTLTQTDSTISVPISIIGNTTDSLTVTACNNYVSPSGNYNLTSSGIYYDTIPNQWSCDSIIKINLTINTVDTSVTANDPTLTSNATGASYQWIDCDNNYTSIVGATNQVFTATTNGNYAVIITENGCTDTSACYQIINANISAISEFAGVVVYPNPTKGILTVQLGDNSAIISLRILNLIGQEILTRNISNEKIIELEINSDNGLYFVEILSSSKQKMIFKVLKY